MSTVDKILTPAQLDQLRAQYSNDWMNNAAYGSVAGSWLQAGPTEQLVIATWTTPRWKDAPHVGPEKLPPAGTPINAVPSMPEGITPKERERVIIALMTVNLVTPMFLAIHIYWGLMEGLSPNDIAWTMLLAGAYEGIDTYSNGVKILTVTLTAMEAVLKAGGKLDSPTVFGALSAAFTPVTQAELAAFAKLNGLKMPTKS